MVKLALILGFLALSGGMVPVHAVNLKGRVDIIEQRVVDFERLQQEQSTSANKRIKAIEKQSAQLLRGYRGFFDELEAFREDLRQIGGTSEEVEHGKRQLSLKLEELEKKLEAQGIELFELKELLKAQGEEKTPGLSGKEAKRKFTQAMALFKKKQWAKAKDSFNEIAKHSEDTDMASEALYYGSYAAFVNKNWKAANAGFSDLVSLYPQSKRRLSSRWRLALGLLSDGQTRNGKTQLKILSKQKTNKTLAKKAKAKLKQLK